VNIHFFGRIEVDLQGVGCSRIWVAGILCVQHISSLLNFNGFQEFKRFGMINYPEKR
jgi:hypothetical protein